MLADTASLGTEFHVLTTLSGPGLWLGYCYHWS